VGGGDRLTGEVELGGLGTHQLDSQETDIGSLVEIPRNAPQIPQNAEQGCEGVSPSGLRLVRLDASGKS